MEPFEESFEYLHEASRKQGHELIGALLELNVHFSQKVNNARAHGKSVVTIGFDEARIISSFNLENAAALSGYIDSLNRCIRHACFQQRGTKLLYLDALKEIAELRKKGPQP